MSFHVAGGSPHLGVSGPAGCSNQAHVSLTSAQAASALSIWESPQVMLSRQIVTMTQSSQSRLAVCDSVASRAEVWPAGAPEVLAQNTAESSAGTSCASTHENETERQRETE